MKFRSPWVMVAAGLVLLLLPESVLGIVSGAQWEIELVRFVGLLISSLAFLREWALDQGGWAALRMRLWMGVSFVCAVAYTFSGEPFLLVALISILFGALASSGIERADLASQRLRESLKRT